MAKNESNGPLSRAEALLEGFIASTKSTRRQQSLRNLAAVLRKRVEHRDNNFQIASIAGECSALGGPSEQTIRNKPGEQFRELIEAYAAVHGGKTRARSSTRSYDDELMHRIITAIPDAQLRTEIVLELAEKRSLQRQLDILRSSTSRGMIIRLPNEASAQGQQQTVTSNAGVELSDVEIVALKTFIGKSNLTNNGWRVAADGRILAESGREITKVGFVSALQRILEAQGR